MDPPKRKFGRDMGLSEKLNLFQDFPGEKNWIQNRSQNKFMQVRHASQDIFF